ncbi:DUF3405 domain-containing protein [Aspergillus udagawae]|uniref:Uncharacterized protein n=1 Tax=Aspergillus udagawae TaxID=91492 RepID=A0A8E0QXD6_9EURO|nr:uncharacterized protein Aud_009503 [Aspergillus udagawae]GIC93024.1 hypothetical protein Aud_009503 [Aspergillus udagawae]
MSVRMFIKDHYVILWPPWLRWRLRSVITSFLALAFVWIITFSARYRSSVTDGPDSEALQDAFQVEFGTAHDVRNEMYFTGGTLSLTSNDGQTTDPLTHPQPIVYDPYPAYNSQDWNRTWRDFPAPTFGSYDAMDLDDRVCADRFARYGAYGYGENETDEVPGFKKPSRVAWDTLQWGNLQQQCLERNWDRYSNESLETKYSNVYPSAIPQARPPRPPQKRAEAGSVPRLFPRSAVLVRIWHDMNWTENDKHYLRSLIMELSLGSGAEYEVFLMVHVKDLSLPIFSDSSTVEQIKATFIPAEFRDIVIFFNNKLLEAWYPNIEEHEPVYQHFQPVQYFSQMYPEFDYVWQLEMDSRNTGHVYHFFDKAVEFAKRQPRKYLWERNAYFYTPEAHGTWEEFTNMVGNTMAGRQSVWGPLPADEVEPVGPRPPVETPDLDDYEWGVGEEAEFITFLPIFDPKGTLWTFPDKIWNFQQGLDTPRRAAVITMSRSSRRLLTLMHEAQSRRGLGLVSEMTAASWCLHHGLKAVHVPHPIYLDGKWTGRELVDRFNPGEPEKINGGNDSIWNWNHLLDHIIYRSSYMFTTYTAEDLFRRWLGFKSDDGGGGKAVIAHT